jgi:APA family basic amino acid/polyamine antiporter
MPHAFANGPELGGILNLPAVGIIAIIAGLLIAGTRESATVNAILVAIKMAALAMFIAVALPVFDASHFEPFMPFGFPRSGPSGSEVGVMAAAAIIFFAFYGFDAIATAAEEAKNPGRDLAIGIVGSMVVCVAIYMAVAAAAIGAVVYSGFADSAEPLALILREIGQPWAARVLGASAVIALPTVILAFFYGQSRIFFTVARDGLLPSNLARVSRRGTPVRITIFTAVVTSVFAGLIPLTAIAALANAGTLAAFIAVCAAMLVLRRRQPNAERKFRAPAATLVATAGILGCLYLFISLPNRTQLFFVAAQVIGLVLYAIYGSRAAERSRSMSRA